MHSTRSRIMLGGAALSLALLVGCTPGTTEQQAGTTEQQVSTSHTLYSEYPSDAKLIAGSDLVVRGVPMKSRVEQLFPEASTETDPLLNPQAGVPKEKVEELERKLGIVVTVSTFRVDEAIKGGVAAGKTIEVRQMGGFFDNVLHQEAHTTILSPGVSYVLFLRDRGNGRLYTPVNPNQGVQTMSAAGSIVPAGKHATSLDIKNIRDLKSAVQSTK